MSTVVELLRQRAEAQATTLAFHFLGDEVVAPEASSISYGELDRAARGIAAALVGRGAAGHPVLLLYPPGLDYVTGFLGCLYAGAVAVPAYPPDPARWDRTLPRLRALVADCGAHLALTVSALAGLAPGLAGTAPELARLDWLATDRLPPGDAGTWAPPPGGAGAPALLQYTSGSTGTPRGVLLSHANLLHNAELVHAGFGTSADTVGVSWLPPYHDMGLIGGILQPIYAGFPVVLMSPLAFLQRPLSWLEIVAGSGATMSGGPSFAFDLCVRKSTPQQRAALDLSQWTVAFCGAEPVRAETLDRFAEAFAPAGFRREAFYPCYGLAEATLIVTGGRPPRVTGSGQVGCGRPLGGQRLVVVDPATGAPRPPGAEGELWLAGPSVAQGYWRRPDETAHTFRARLAGEPDHDYLRTGDLGFLTPDGELVVTGRIKDLIIVRGRNVYPQDLERAVERAVPGLRPGASAAFPVVRGGEEQVGIACELAEPPAGDRGPAATDAAGGTGATIAAIRQVVAEAAEVGVATVVLLRRGRVPKTSSGKIQRYACRQAVGSGEWDAGTRDVLARWDQPDDRHSAGDSTAPEAGRIAGDGAVREAGRSAGDGAAIVTGLVAGALGLPPGAVPADQPLTQLGLDSLRAIELQGALQTGLGFRVPLSDLLTGVTAGELAERAAGSRPEPGPETGHRVAGASTPTDPAEQPASDGQRALWLIQRWAPDSTAYQISRAARIRSPLDPDRLERGLRAAVDRHPALRTCLPTRGGEPVQRVFEWSGPVLTRHEVAGLDEAALRRRVQADADSGFDLARGPLFRASLYSRGEADHVLLLSLHHTITDFWSLTVLADELLADYAGNPSAGTAPAGAPPAGAPPAGAPPAGAPPAGAPPAGAPPAGAPPAWAPPAGAPTGSIMDVPARPAGDPPRDLHDQRVRYWREVLDGAPPALELPTSFPRPRLQSFRGATQRLWLDPGVLGRLDGLARAAGLTRFAVVAAGFAAVLARYAGERDVVLGAPTAGRDRRQHHQLGYFVNPVPLRIQVDPAGSFRDLAGQVRQVVAGALDHAIPFPRLVEAVRPVRDPGRTPVLQAMVVLHRPPAGRPDLGAFAVADESASIQLGGLDLQPYRLAERGTGFDVSLSLAEVAGGLAGELSYGTDLFDPAMVARLAGHLTRLLARATADPDRPLGTLELLDEPERAAVLAMATGPARPFPDRGTLDWLLARQAARQPDAVAVVAGGQQLTYAELDDRAGRLAARLVQEHGVRPGDLVGVHLPRGLDAIVAFWAALRCGGAYLPLAPDLPPARLAWMVTDARPAVLLTHQALAGRVLAELAAGDRPLVRHLDAASLPDPRPVPAGTLAGPDDLAYVLYTSGSTGRPKAVMIPHRSATNLAHALVAGLEITPASRVLQYATCSYDVHISDILGAHLSGAALHLPPDDAAVPGPAMVRLLAQQRITHVTLSPSVLAALPDADLPALTHILCGGETCPPEVVARWGRDRQFLNAYGPTETTVCVTWLACRPDRRRPPIGAPMPNSRVYVLDGAMAPVPVGVPGELYIGGAGVGWGYLGRPELTAARFVPDPFDRATGARLYRTGDRARWLPDGTVDFLGRFDDQVQIRGIRVEPGEVEVRIRELLGIREVAVLPRTGPGGGTELVAYLVVPEPAAVTAAGPGLTAAVTAARPRLTVPELRGVLRAELPEPWVPAAFVHLEALPLNASGKLDRWALPAPAPTDRGLAERLAPRTALERTVAQVWADALGQTTVGVRDHFFDELGGSSLLVGQVTSELGRRLDREIPVTLLFEHPTVEALARRLAGVEGPERAGTAPEDQAARRRRALARPTSNRREPAG